MPGSLQDRLALVTGAGRGIGAATAEALAREGAHVVLVARTAAELEAVEERIHAGGGSATIAPMDLTERDSIARLAQAIGERWGRLDILILNAAMLGSLSPVAQIDGKELNKVLTLNLLAQQALIAGFDPLLRKSEDARVIGLTSSVSARPRAFWGGYAASKAALDALLLAYADEVENTTAIRVALVNPGATATHMRAKAFPGEDPATIKQPEEVADAILELLTSDFATGSRIEVGS